MQAKMSLNQARINSNMQQALKSRNIVKEYKRFSVFQQPTSLLSRMTPKRFFNDKFDRQLGRLLERLPGGNIGYLIAGLNTAIYFLYLIWPNHNRFSFMNNFTFSMYGLNKGYVHNLVTCHFTHMSFLSYLLDTAICYMFC